MKEKLVALSGTGTSALPIRFEPPEELFSSKHVIEAEVPSDESLETFENYSDFKKLTSEKDNARNILILPPFAVVTMLSLHSLDPSKMSQAMSATSLKTQQKLLNHDEFDASDHVAATNYILAFLWCHQKKMLRSLPYGVSNDNEVSFWADHLHSSSLMSKLPVVLSTSNCVSPSDHTLSKLGTSLHNLNDALLKAKESSSEKKDKFDSLDTFSQNLILNVSAMPLSAPATSPSPTFLELLNCSSTAKARMSFNNKL